MSVDFKRIKAIEKRNKDKILKHCPIATDTSGIYIFSREDNGFRYAYVGQAKKLLTRLSQHLSNYQHIDLSIKKHGLYSANNTTGYKISIFPCTINELDEQERLFILEMANAGYQLRNKTSGGQDKGKAGIAPNKPSRGYHDGLRQGYKKAQKEVAKMFQYLTAHCDTTKKRAVNALGKLNEFLEGGNE